MPVLLREGQHQDQPVMAEIYWSCFHEVMAPLAPPEALPYRTRDYFEHRLDLYPQLLVAEEVGHIVGFAAWAGGYIDALFIRPRWRNQGVGERLLAGVEQRIAAAGLPIASLFAFVGNDGAKRFYERHGWQIIGTETGVPMRWCETSRSMVPIADVTGVRLWAFEKRLIADAT